MKNVFFALFIVFSTFANAQNMTGYWSLMQKGVESEAASKKLIDNAQSAFNTTKKPIYQAFYAMGTFLLAKHAGNPLSQFSYFKKGKNALDNAVKNDPKNVEIRFLRYVTQESAPKFLGYSKELNSDKSFILKEYKKSNNEDLIRRIAQHFKIS